MAIQEEVVARARELVEVMHQRRRGLVDKRAALSAELEALETELARADDADERLRAFWPQRDGENLCPYCWMYDRAERPLFLVERDLSDVKVDPGLMFFRCLACGTTLTESSGDVPLAAIHPVVGCAEPTPTQVQELRLPGSGLAGVGGQASPLGSDLLSSPASARQRSAS